MLEKWWHQQKTKYYFTHERFRNWTCSFLANFNFTRLSFLTDMRMTSQM